MLIIRGSKSDEKAKITWVGLGDSDQWSIGRRIKIYCFFRAFIFWNAEK